MSGKVKEPKKYRIYQVVWQDSSVKSGWYSRDEFLEFASQAPLIIKTVGWMIGESKTVIFLAQSVGGKHLGELYSIPKACIVDIQVVRWREH
jgi:hypothetical protein